MGTSPRVAVPILHRRKSRPCRQRQSKMSGTVSPSRPGPSGHAHTRTSTHVDAQASMRASGHADGTRGPGRQARRFPFPPAPGTRKVPCWTPHPCHRRLCSSSMCQVCGETGSGASIPGFWLPITRFHAIRRYRRRYYCRFFEPGSKSKVQVPRLSSHREATKWSANPGDRVTCVAALIPWACPLVVNG